MPLIGIAQISVLGEFLFHLFSCYYRLMDIRERFLKHVNKTTRCWFWTGAINDKGYGWVSRSKKLGPPRAHRLSYELFVGRIPKGRWVLHKCDVPLCVRPNHLFIGTPKDNTQDMLRKGRAVRGEKASWSKIKEDDVRAIRASTESQRTLAKRYGMGQQSISLIKRRINWKHVV